MPDSNLLTNFEFKRELKRKSLHLPGLMVPFAYQWQPYLTLLGLGLMSVLYYISELRRLSKTSPFPVIGFLSARLTRSDHLDLAPVYLAVGLGVGAMLLPIKAAFAGALLVCLCDGVAAVIGMKFGKHKIIFLKKTYLGTLAFFVAAMLSLVPLLGWQGALITAASASFVEALSIEGIDNFLLPVVGGMIAKQFL